MCWFLIIGCTMNTIIILHFVPIINVIVSFSHNFSWKMVRVQSSKRNGTSRIMSIWLNFQTTALNFLNSPVGVFFAHVRARCYFVRSSLAICFCGIFLWLFADVMCAHRSIISYAVAILPDSFMMFLFLVYFFFITFLASTLAHFVHPYCSGTPFSIRFLPF